MSDLRRELREMVDHEDPDEIRMMERVALAFARLVVERLYPWISHEIEGKGADYCRYIDGKGFVCTCGLVGALVEVKALLSDPPQDEGTR